MKELEEYIRVWDIEKEFTIEEDCVHFVLGAYKIITGKDVSSIIGKYSSAQEWFDKNNKSIEDTITEITNKLPVSAKEAKYGDIVSLTIDGKTSVGICKGARAYFVQHGKTKLIRVPLRMCNYSWGVEWA